MGTFCEIEAVAADSDTALLAIQAAFQAVDDLSSRMHPARAGSEVAAINRAVRGEHVDVGRHTRRVLEFATELHTQSGGIFDPCVPTHSGRMRDVVLDEVGVVCANPVLLDLGGVAKGYAIDVAIESLRDAGCSAGCVNIGGDLKLFGAAPREIAVRCLDGHIETLTLTNRSIAVSAVVSADRPPEHAGYYSRNVQRTLQASFALVLADDAMVADALTKCALFCTADEMAALARKYAADWLRFP